MSEKIEGEMSPLEPENKTRELERSQSQERADFNVAFEQAYNDVLRTYPDETEYNLAVHIYEMLKEEGLPTEVQTTEKDAKNYLFRLVYKRVEETPLSELAELKIRSMIMEYIRMQPIDPLRQRVYFRAGVVNDIIESVHSEFPQERARYARVDSVVRREFLKLISPEEVNNNFPPAEVAKMSPVFQEIVRRLKNMKAVVFSNSLDIKGVDGAIYRFGYISYDLVNEKVTSQTEIIYDNNFAGYRQEWKEKYDRNVRLLLYGLRNYWDMPLIFLAYRNLRVNPAISILKHAGGEPGAGSLSKYFISPRIAVDTKKRQLIFEPEMEAVGRWIGKQGSRIQSMERIISGSGFRLKIQGRKYGFQDQKREEGICSVDGKEICQLPFGST